MLSEEGKKVKKELESLNQIKRKLRNLQEELMSWKQLDGTIKAAGFEEHVSGGEVVPYAQRRVIKIEELERQISQAVDEAITYEDKFLKDIAALDVFSQNLLMERYMTGKSLQRIMREFNYSRAQIFRLYDGCFERLSVKDETK